MAHIAIRTACSFRRQNPNLYGIAGVIGTEVHHRLQEAKKTTGQIDPLHTRMASHLLGRVQIGTGLVDCCVGVLADHFKK